jgi:hypothetical protein
MIKSIVLSICCLSIAISTFAQQQAFKGEEAEIVSVIEAESRHFWARDLDAWKDTWVHKDYVNWTAISEAGIRRYQGWDAWLDQVKTFMKDDPEPQVYDKNVRKYNYQFRIYKKGAWVAFEQDDNGTITYETRIMEKRKGKWRIAMVQLFFDWGEKDAPLKEASADQE